MDRVILALDCESSGHGQVLVSANGSHNTVTGWFISGPKISLLTLAEAFKCEANQFDILSSITKNKDVHFARVSSEKKIVTICKRVDDITIKVLEFHVTEIPLDASASSSSMEDVANSLESHLAAAQAQLARQSAELASLRQRCGQLADKYAAAVDESAGSRDRLLGAFCRVLNAKKALIGELLAGRDGGKAEKSDDDNGSETDAGSEGVGKSPPSGKPAGRGGGGVGGGKRKSPSASASKPPVRRTRSNAKKSRGGGGAADGDNSDA